MLRYVRSLGIGPLYDDPPSGGAPTGDPAPGAPPPAPAGGGGGAPPAPADPPPTPEQTIPYARFAQVNGELAALRKEKEEREAADAKAKGEHEKLYESEKAKREAAESRVALIARRAAFIGAAAAKVSDPEAAYKLAAADGMLEAIELDEDGSAKDSKAVEKVVEELTKKYVFLKGTSKSFGDPAGGTPPAPPTDVSKLSGRDLLSLGYAQGAQRSGRS